MATLVGIDPSLSSTAIACGNQAGFLSMKLFGSEPHRGDVTARMVRFARMVEQILRYLESFNAADPIKLIAIEGYSFGSRGSGVSDLYEFGGLLRLRLTQRFHLCEVPPTALKRYVAGKGNAPKPAFVSALARKYHCDFQGEDEYFAYGLFLLARSAIFPEMGTKQQAEIAADCLLPKQKLGKKPKAESVVEGAKPF